MNSRAAIVGGFILGALAIAVAAILFFGGMRLFATSSRAVVFFGESVAGLDAGSPVTFHGVRIGSIQSVAIHFSADTMTASTPVYLQLEPNRVILVGGRKFTGSDAEYEDLVRAGLRAQLALQSFVTGQLRVDLDFRPGTPEQRVGAIEDLPEIPTVPSELGQLRNQLAQLPLRELADAAQQALASVGRLADHLDTQLTPLSKSALHTADAAAQTLETADRAIQRVQADASGALHDLDLLLVDARGQLNGRGGELSRALVAADRTIRQAETILDSLNGLTDPRSPFRGDLEATLRDLAATASFLRDFAQTIERDPNALLMGRGAR